MKRQFIEFEQNCELETPKRKCGEIVITDEFQEDMINDCDELEFDVELPNEQFNPQNMKEEERAIECYYGKWFLYTLFRQRIKVVDCDTEWFQKEDMIGILDSMREEWNSIPSEKKDKILEPCWKSNPTTEIEANSTLPPTILRSEEKFLISSLCYEFKFIPKSANWSESFQCVICHSSIFKAFHYYSPNSSYIDSNKKVSFFGSKFNIQPDLFITLREPLSNPLVILEKKSGNYNLGNCRKKSYRLDAMRVTIGCKIGIRGFLSYLQYCQQLNKEVAKKVISLGVLLGQSDAYCFIMRPQINDHKEEIEIMNYHLEAFRFNLENNEDMISFLCLIRWFMKRMKLFINSIPKPMSKYKKTRIENTPSKFISLTGSTTRRLESFGTPSSTSSIETFLSADSQRQEKQKPNIPSSILKKPIKYQINGKSRVPLQELKSNHHNEERNVQFNLQLT